MTVHVAVALSAQFMTNLVSESEESSDDDQEVALILIKTKYKRQPSRIHNYLDTVSNYTAKEFQQHFRITLETYETLLTIIGVQLSRKNNRGRNTINIDTQLLAVIWLLATPDSYRLIDTLTS